MCEREGFCISRYCCKVSKSGAEDSSMHILHSSWLCRLTVQTPIARGSRHTCFSRPRNNTQEALTIPSVHRSGRYITLQKCRVLTSCLVFLFNPVSRPSSCPRISNISQANNAIKVSEGLTYLKLSLACEPWPLTLMAKYLNRARSWRMHESFSMSMAQTLLRGTLRARKAREPCLACRAIQSSKW